jgi:ubiquinone/menaquinone biosynthesis C-methylase UbiE
MTVTGQARSHTTFELEPDAAHEYERFKVPQLFGPMAERLLERIPVAAGERVLDVACGTGVVARLAARAAGASGRVVGVDCHEGMLAVARAVALPGAAPIEWRAADAAALPFTDGTFDTVFCQQAMQFFTDRAGALGEMRRVLAAGGRVGVSVFAEVNRYNAALAEGLAALAGEQAGRRALLPFSLPDAAELRQLATRAGLRGAEVTRISLIRRVQPSQEWLLRDTGGTPHGPAVLGLDAVARARLVREIAAKLKGLWDVDAFLVPTPIHILHARK